MATSVLSNTILDPTGVAVANVPVIARLRGVAGGFKSSTFTEIATAVATTTNSSGFWSLALERQADILPLGSYWEIEEKIPDSNGGSRFWIVTVGSVNTTLYAALITTPPPGDTGPTYLTQAAGDARYIAVAGGQAVLLTPPSDTQVLRVRGFSGQTADLQQWQDSAATVLAKVTSTGSFQTPALAISGLTGAAQASRYVGATAGGKPTSGTFAVGDYIIDQAGYIWICTAAGTPGTWVSPARGTIGYAQITASQSGITTEVDATGLSVNVAVGTSRRIRISGIGIFQSTVIDDVAEVLIKEGATQLNTAIICLRPVNSNISVCPAVVLTPTAGNHTYKLAVRRTSGTGSLSYGASATLPAYILVEDIGGV